MRRRRDVIDDLRLVPAAADRVRAIATSTYGEVPGWLTTEALWAFLPPSRWPVRLAWISVALAATTTFLGILAVWLVIS